MGQVAGDRPAAAVVGASAAATTVMGAAVAARGGRCPRASGGGAAPIATGVRYVHEPGGVAAGHRVVGRVRVAVDLLGVGQFEDGVVGDETADCRVVFAGAEVGQAGRGVLDAVDEALVAEPGAGGGLGAAGVAEGVEAAAGRGLGGGIDGGFGGVVGVRDLPLKAAGTGADRDGLAAQL